MGRVESLLFLAGLAVLFVYPLLPSSPIVNGVFLLLLLSLVLRSISFARTRGSLRLPTREVSPEEKALMSYLKKLRPRERRREVIQLGPATIATPPTEVLITRERDMPPIIRGDDLLSIPDLFEPLSTSGREASERAPSEQGQGRSSQTAS